MAVSDFECSICGALCATPLFGITSAKHGRLRYYRCSACASVSLERASVLAIENDEPCLREPRRFSKPFAWLRDQLRMPRLKLVMELTKGQGRVLDVGCGDCSFLRQLKAHNIAAEGIELAPFAAKCAAEGGVKVHLGSLHSAGLGHSSFKIVTLWHVFEHLTEVREDMREAGRLLEAGGSLIISIPSIESLQFALFGKHWLHMAPPVHYTLPTINGLTQMLSDYGFILAERRHIGWYQDIFGLLQSSLNVLFQPRDQLLHLLKGADIPNRGIHLAAACIFLLPAVVFSLIENGIGRPGTVELVYSKAGSKAG